MKTKKFNHLMRASLSSLGLLSLVVGGGLPVQADEVPYTPSKYPGVTVRHVPQSAASKSGTGMNKGWIYVKPGATKPRLGDKYGTRGAGVWYEPGKTKAGGTAAHVDRGFYPYVTARVVHPNQKGQQNKVTLECVEGHNATQHKILPHGKRVTAQPLSPKTNQAVSAQPKTHQAKTQVRY